MHRDRPGMPVALDEGLKKVYFKSILSHRVSRRFSQNVARHLPAHQLSPEPADLHLPGANRFAVHAFELSSTRRLDPVEQPLVKQSQCSGGRSNTFSTRGQPDRFLLAFERVARP